MGKPKLSDYEKQERAKKRAEDRRKYEFLRSQAHMEEENRLLAERTGTTKMNSKLVSFLYDLMRDYVTVGQIHRLVSNAQEQPVTYTNGHLARYAQYVASRLTK
jgi:hypothetical protein